MEVSHSTEKGEIAVLSQLEASGLFARRPLGSTGLHVTSICIGAALLGNMPEDFAYEVSEEQALATVRAFFAGPFNFLDTAASYGGGESERRIGIVLRERGGLPPGFMLGTKADREKVALLLALLLLTSGPRRDSRKVQMYCFF